MRTLQTSALIALILPAASIAQEAPPPDNAPAPGSTREANLQAAPQPPVTTREPGARPGDPERIVTTYPGNLKPPPVSSLNKEYPVCGGAVQDNCRNPGGR